MNDFDLFIAVPTHDNRLHTQTCGGLLDTQREYGDRCSVVVHCGHLPVARDVLVAAFLDSKATHMLCVDSDIGFRAAHVDLLLRADRDCVSGLYLKKRDDAELAVHGRPLSRDGDMIEVPYIPAGFLLLRRAVLEKMVEHYADLVHGAGKLHALWLPRIADAVFEGDDTSFSSRMRRVGFRAWLHSRCHLDHWGEHRYSIANVVRAENGTLSEEPKP